MWKKQTKEHSSQLTGYEKLLEWRASPGAKFTACFEWATVWVTVLHGGAGSAALLLLLTKVTRHRLWIPRLKSKCDAVGREPGCCVLPLQRTFSGFKLLTPRSREVGEVDAWNNAPACRRLHHRLFGGERISVWSKATSVKRRGEGKKEWILNNGACLWNF